MIGSVAKVRRRDDGVLAAAVGDATYCQAFLDWFDRNDDKAPPEAKLEDNFIDRGAIFWNDGTIEVFEPRGSFKFSAPYYALGSGKDPALGAMFAGADAEVAVRAAIKHDPHTGGPVVVAHRSIPGLIWR